MCRKSQNNIFRSLLYIFLIYQVEGFQMDTRQLTWSPRPVDPQIVPVDRLLSSLRVSASRQKDAVPGVSYPIYTQVNLDTPFYCNDVNGPGFYADTYMRCQQYHRCDDQGRRSTYLCPEGTLFNQVTLVCDFWYNVDCAKGKDFVEYSNSRLILPGIQLFDSSLSQDDINKLVSSSRTKAKESSSGKNTDGSSLSTQPKQPVSGSAKLPVPSSQSAKDSIKTTTSASLRSSQAGVAAQGTSSVSSGRQQSGAGQGVSVGGSVSIGMQQKESQQIINQGANNQPVSEGAPDTADETSSESENSTSGPTIKQPVALDRDRTARLLSDQNTSASKDKVGRVNTAKLTGSTASVPSPSPSSTVVSTSANKLGIPSDEATNGEEFEGLLNYSQPSQSEIPAQSSKPSSSPQTPAPTGNGLITSLASYRKPPAAGTSPIDQSGNDGHYETLINSVWEPVPNGTESPHFDITTTFASSAEDLPQNDLAAWKLPSVTGYTSMGNPDNGNLQKADRTSQNVGNDRESRRLESQSSPENAIQADGNMPAGNGQIITSAAEYHGTQPAGNSQIITSAAEYRGTQPAGNSQIITSAAEYRGSGVPASPKPIITSESQYRAAARYTANPSTKKELPTTTTSAPPSTTPSFVANVSVVSDTLKVNSASELTPMKADNIGPIITSEAVYKTEQNSRPNEATTTSTVAPKISQNSPVSVQVVTACDQAATVELQGNELVDAMMSSLKTSHNDSKTVGITINAARTGDVSSSEDSFSQRYGDIWDAVPAGSESTTFVSNGSESTTFVSKAPLNNDAYYIYETADKPVIIKFAKYNIIVQVRPNP
ncbi:mucin-5AC-like isoform X2 [Paramacrobiotus metropolitanus]|uniref:mucin-5AC-like isoform X2 n=1 Tax=Paramacrobiotus metropolitanus TaxID=2943436 RepID=UPI0024462825|nr:mucin-5AC-like isoform X2 [Paramacrobiotus metropolitanus]